MFYVDGMMFKHRFRAAVDREAAKEKGIDLDGIVSPYTIWSNLPTDKRVVFTHPADNDNKTLKDPLYKKLSEDPGYAMIDAYCNN